MNKRRNPCVKTEIISGHKNLSICCCGNVPTFWKKLSGEKSQFRQRPTLLLPLQVVLVIQEMPASTHLLQRIIFTVPKTTQNLFYILKARVTVHPDEGRVGFLTTAY
eukprot:snap_masked-scaffold_5-processed-gene-9.39-mRNA-1 protein AED:1.00 eAED:1.00 QI:0/0/0/0/1/1/2/0/106